MNKLLKIIISIFGGINQVNNFAMPVAVMLLWINSFGVSRLGDKVLIVVLLCSSFYQALKNVIKVLITDGEK